MNVYFYLLLYFVWKVLVFAALVAVVAAGGYHHHHQPEVYKQEKSYMIPAPHYPAHHEYKETKPVYQPEYKESKPEYKETKPAYQPEYKSAEYEKKSYEVKDIYFKFFFKNGKFLYEIQQVPSPYSFEWAVKDDYTYNNYGQKAIADDKGKVTGSYYTLLPDGRTQTVTYTADDYNGYVAHVKYEGEAKYPEYKSADSYHKTPYYPEHKVPAVKYEHTYPQAKY